MIKRGRLLSACFGAFFASCAIVAIGSNAFAESSIFKLKSAEIKDKSIATEAAISVKNETTATNTVTYHNLGEFVEYKLALENTDAKTRRVLSATISSSIEYVSYKYDSKIETNVSSGDSFDFIFKMIYDNEVESAAKAQQQFDATITITYENDSGEPETATLAVTTDPKINNPSTDSDAIIITQSVIILIASVSTIIAVFYYSKKHKKVTPVAIALIATAAVTFVAIRTNAASTSSDDITIDNNVTFYYKDCQGICYNANSGAAKGTMADQSATAGQEITLFASNFSLESHGFAGWNTKANGTGTMYGPNQTITMPSSGALKLYAIWIESAGNMVGFVCDDLQDGDITALNDTDGQTYAVAKLADGNCWTIENSRRVTATSVNENTAEDRAGEPTEDGAVYAYGNYYDEDDARNDAICPTGWRLPSGGSDGDYRNLESALDPSEAQTEEEQVMAWTSFPNNFIYSGVYAPGYGAYMGSSTDSVYRGGLGYYYGGDALYDHGNSSYNLYATMLSKPGYMGISATFIAGQNMGSGSGIFMPARCVTGQSYGTEKTFTLNYDANGGDSAPQAQTETAQGNTYSFTITDEEPTRYHYHLYAWVEESNKDKDITQEYIYEDERFHAGDVYMVSNTATLYAIWEENCTNIHYLPNGNSVEGEMPVQQVCPPKQSATLIAPNFSLAGNGYIGWNTKADGTGTMYGPNEYITLPDEDDIYLYAQWQPAEQGITMQTFNENNEPYASAPQNTVIALRDERDDNVYAIAKLADNHWWMIENLRLDLNDPNITINSTNTNNPTQAFLTEYNSQFHGNATTTVAPCQTLGEACEDRISFSTADVDRSNPASYNDNDNVTSWYGYGAHYNWYTATAGHGLYYTNSTYAGGDICPANWHIPTGRTGTQTSALDIAMGGNGYKNTTHDITNNWLSYPVNLTLAGSYSVDDTGSSRGTQGKIWTGSSKPEMNQYEQGLTIVINNAGDSYFGNNQSTTNKWYALSVRCMAGHQERDVDD